MITAAEYLDIISEAYDLSDSDSKKMYLFCNEAQKTTNIEHLTNRLYEHIKDQTDSIDFGTIPKSKGNITKVENFQNLVDCIDVIHDLVKQYGENTEIVDQISTAINNVQVRESLFSKAFLAGIELPVMTYNATVLSIYSSVSLLILTCIEYVKNGKESFVASFDKASYTKTKDHVMYQYIVGFNRSCQNSTLDKLMQECIKANIVATREDGDLIDTAKAVGGVIFLAWSIGSIIVKIFKGGGLISSFLYPLRAFFYQIKYTQMKFSDWLAVQADFLQINAENLKYREDRKGSDTHREKVYNRQIKWVERLRKLSNIFALKDKKAQKTAEEEQRRDDRRDQQEDKERRDRDSDYDDDDGDLF